MVATSLCSFHLGSPVLERPCISKQVADLAVWTGLANCDPSLKKKMLGTQGFRRNEIRSSKYMSGLIRSRVAIVREGIARQITFNNCDEFDHIMRQGQELSLSTRNFKLLFQLVFTLC